MRADEIARAVTFYRVVMVIVAGVLATLPWLGGDLSAKWTFAAGLVVYAVAETWFVAAIRRDPDQYCDRNLYPLGISGVFAAFAGVYYCGVFSPAPAMIVMALYVNSLIGSRRYPAVIYGLCAGCQAALAAAVMAGAIPDRGLVVPRDWPLSSQVLVQLIVQGVYLATFLIGRLSRRATAEAFSKVEEVARAVAQRDALLAEARHELERAAWVGEPGRFTDQRVGSFRLGAVVGRGAMGEVYEATRESDGRDAAVKLLHRNVLADPEHVARFAREAEAVATIDSPHVVRVLEVSDPSAPTPYIAMERLTGEHLGAVLQRRRRLPPADVVVMVDHVARGIDAAAARGVVHRDLKPQNVFCAHTERGPVWKILDFGVSKLADEAGTLTGGNAVGTPAYMSPEQARGLDIDHRTDVYALGAIAYRCLTGQPAFSGRDVPMILHEVVYRVPVRPSLLAAELPEDVDRVLAIALAKRREDRFDCGGELADAFAAAVRGALGDRLRRRADALVARYPWGRAIV